MRHYLLNKNQYKKRMKKNFIRDFTDHADLHGAD